jgi:phosphoglucosamine mutase
LLAALVLIESLARSHVSLDQAITVMQSYPQMLINVRTAERVLDPVSDLADEIRAMEETLGADGRVLVRASGTEPLVRVMVEAQTESLALSSALTLANAVIAQHGGAVEGTH